MTLDAGFDERSGSPYGDPRPEHNRREDTQDGSHAGRPWKFTTIDICFGLH